MMPEDVVEYSLKNLSRKRVIVIPGWRNRVLGRFMRMPVFRPLVRALTRQQRTVNSSSTRIPVRAEASHRGEWV
jgi:hypothetical protein